VARRGDHEARYKEKIRKQQQALEKYTAHEIERAGDLFRWYRLRGRDMPDEVYRAAAFFKNKEFLTKPGPLTLLYLAYGHLMGELPGAAKEIAFDLLAYRCLRCTPKF
jgi:hypothetical protein